MKLGGVAGQLDQPNGGRSLPLRVLSLTALGIVYGDIGTSPLYAFREAFLPAHGVSAQEDANVLGVLSLIFWALILVVSVKYLVFILRADNRGEGGILALTGLVTAPHKRGARNSILLALGLFGASLLYGDGMLTPAVSVLSAVEGLKVITPSLGSWVVPITVAILASLFMLQRSGTAKIGALFGPVTLLWFIVIALIGVFQIAAYPEVLLAVSPHHAVEFLIRNGFHAFLVLGSVFLVVTGGEALYADMGHLGRKPISVAWFAVVLPALVLNYFGQGALVLRSPEAVAEPFFSMVPYPGLLLLPVVLIATAATVIASQALISGSYSLTMHAMQLGYAPRLRIAHTSPDQFGQIYIPAINWALMFACIALVLSFRTSSGLTAAYGVAVTMTMTVTTILLYFVARDVWGWSALSAGLLVGPFLVIDCAFLGANLLKIPQGGWLPIVGGAAVFLVLTTWKRGRSVLTQRMDERSLPADLLVQQLSEHPTRRAAGTAVFLHRRPGVTPPALLHNWKHNGVVHERVVLMSVLSEDTPHVVADRRIVVESMGQGVHQVTVRHGFMEQVDVPAELSSVELDGHNIKPMDTTYFLGRETLVLSDRPAMLRWRSRLFGFLYRNERSAAAHFKLPPNRVVELGAQIEL